MCLLAVILLGSIAIGSRTCSGQSTSNNVQCKWRDSGTVYDTSVVPNAKILCRQLSIVSEMWCTRESPAHPSKTSTKASLALNLVRTELSSTTGVFVINGGKAVDTSVELYGASEEVDSNWKGSLAKAILGSRGDAQLDSCSVSRSFTHCFSGAQEWAVALSVPLKCSNASASRSSGFFSVIIPRRSLLINHCKELQNTCDPKTTTCISTREAPDRANLVEEYGCQCQPGFYMPGSWLDSPHFVNASSSASRGSSNNSSLASCVKCPKDQCPPVKGCQWRDSGQLCGVELDSAMRLGFIVVQIIFIVLTIVLVIFVTYFRKTRVIASAMWTMLVMILIGCGALYGVVIVYYFEASAAVCLLGPWTRALGFVQTYGSINLKIYKIQVEFRRRKAHRWIIKNRDMLMYLGVIVVLVVFHMIGWTVSAVMDYSRGLTLVSVGQTSEGRMFTYCRRTPLEYLSIAAELCALCYAVYVSHRIRRAEVEFNERRLLSLCIYLELISSIAYNVAFPLVADFLHPDLMLTMMFVRCHLATTPVIVLFFGSKIWHLVRRTTNNTAGNDQDYDGPEDVENKVLEISEMDPEVIKEELRRIYTQLQVLQHRAMRKDNPHISKRRGGRKATHRRFSLQGFHHRQQTANSQSDSQARHDRNPQKDGESDVVGQLPPASAIRHSRYSSVHSKPISTMSHGDDDPPIVYPDGPSTISVDIGMAARGIGRKRFRQFTPTEC